MWLIKVLVFLWPFIKEMILGGMSIKDAIRTNKRSVFIFIVITLSLILNILTVSRLIVITNDYIELKNKPAPSIPAPAPVKDKVCVVIAPRQSTSKKDDKALRPRSKNTNTKEVHDRDVNTTSNYIETKDKFNKIIQKENSEKNVN